MLTRRHVHTRTIRIDAYARDDGLWDLEAELTDVKSRDFKLATGIRSAGDPVHDMLLTLTIDTAANVVAASAAWREMPYPGRCDENVPDYSQLVGLNLLADFRKQVLARFAGVRGCTHVTELAIVLPTAAVQAFAGEVFKPHDATHAGDKKPWQLDRCHALKSDGPAVAEFYPRWHRLRGDASNEEVTPVKDGTTS
jgi:hypothetical protein